VWVKNWLNKTVQPSAYGLQLRLWEVLEFLRDVSRLIRINWVITLVRDVGKGKPQRFVIRMDKKAKSHWQFVSERSLWLVAPAN
jgi:hypothetical protein